jgi:hypothetical protein
MASSLPFDLSSLKDHLQKLELPKTLQDSLYQLGRRLENAKFEPLQDQPAEKCVADARLLTAVEKFVSDLKIPKVRKS